MALFESQIEEKRFDHVQFPGNDEVAAGTWTQHEFEKLPLVDRIRMLAGGGLRFFHQGKQISCRDALKRS